MKKIKKIPPNPPLRKGGTGRVARGNRTRYARQPEKARRTLPKARRALLPPFLKGGGGGFLFLLLVTGCTPSNDGVAVPGHPDAVKTSAEERALRRAYDGAPPVIAHADLGAACVACHNREGLSVPDLGFAPASPHDDTAGMSVGSRCRQCHVFHQTDEVFADSEFVGFAQDLRSGRRLHELAPPVIPHQLLMRENCQACHAGPAAREEIRTSHPERIRCLQCHLEQRSTSLELAFVKPQSR